MPQVLIAGTGFMGGLHERVLSRHTSTLTCHNYIDYQRLLNEYPSLVGIVLAVPFDWNEMMARDALLRNKHVFVEKPLTERYSSAEGLVALASQRCRSLMVGQILRFFPILKDLSSYLGYIGQLQHIRGLRCTRKTLRPWWSRMRRFLLSYEGVHSIDLLIRLTGAVPSISLCKLRYALPGFAGETAFDLEMTLDGSSVVLHHDMCAPYEENEIQFIGKSDQIRFVNFSEIYLGNHLVLADSFENQFSQAVTAEMVAFWRNITLGEESQASGSSVLPTMKCIEEAYGCAGLNCIEGGCNVGRA